ncbi:MAG: A/G-specific adenine glycosylase, partial [Thermus sp.]
MEKLQKALLAWYRENPRSLPWRGEKDPYRILVAEVLLQQTRTAQAIPY